MVRMTITEALADIKTINNRIAKNWEFISPRLARQGLVMDPLTREGTSTPIEVAKRRQSSADLRQRLVNLRSAIVRANQANELTIEGVTRTVADWIIWRREIAPSYKVELQQIAGGIESFRRNLRQTIQKAGVDSVKEAAALEEIIYNVSETELASERDKVEKILGDLDGRLSLLNATTCIEIAD